MTNGPANRTTKGAKAAPKPSLADIKVNGATVAVLRRLNGLDLKGLAERTGLSMSYICEIEKGTKDNLRAPTMKKLADGLGVPIAALAREPEVL